MTTDKRLIEVEFLLEQVSIETVRQGASLDAAYLADALAECPLSPRPCQTTRAPRNTRS